MKSYEEKMLEAFIGKPKKYEWYKKSFNTFNSNGILNTPWNWSWWAFFGGATFLLHRKIYLASLIIYILAIQFHISLLLLSGVTEHTPVKGIGIPLFTIFSVFFLFFRVLSGGYATFFIYMRYLKKKLKIESTVSDENERILEMQKIGGYHKWYYIIFISLILFSLLHAILIPKLIAYNACY